MKRFEQEVNSRLSRSLSMEGVDREALWSAVAQGQTPARPRRPPQTPLAPAEPAGQPGDLGTGGVERRPILRLRSAPCPRTQCSPLLQNLPTKLHTRLPAQRKALDHPLFTSSASSAPASSALPPVHPPSRVTLLRNKSPAPTSNLMVRPLSPSHLLLQELPAVPMETVEHLQRLQLQFQQGEQDIRW